MHCFAQLWFISWLITDERTISFKMENVKTPFSKYNAATVWSLSASQHSVLKAHNWQENSTVLLVKVQAFSCYCMSSSLEFVVIFESSGHVSILLCGIVWLILLMFMGLFFLLKSFGRTASLCRRMREKSKNSEEKLKSDYFLSSSYDIYVNGEILMLSV